MAEAVVCHHIRYHQHNLWYKLVTFHLWVPLEVHLNLTLKMSSLYCSFIYMFEPHSAKMIQHVREFDTIECCFHINLLSVHGPILNYDVTSSSLQNELFSVRQVDVLYPAVKTPKLKNIYTFIDNGFLMKKENIFLLGNLTWKDHIRD